MTYEDRIERALEVAQLRRNYHGTYELQIKEAISAFLGDTVLYERATVHSHGGTGGDGCTNLRCDKGLGPCFGMTQVYPEVKE